jgi:hypothetical protein
MGMLSPPPPFGLSSFPNKPTASLIGAGRLVLEQAVVISPTTNSIPNNFFIIDNFLRLVNKIFGHH